MPSESSSVAATLKSLDGNGLLDVLNGATQSNVDVCSSTFFHHSTIGMPADRPIEVSLKH